MSSMRATVEWMILNEWTDKEISRALTDKGYNLTADRVAEMREEMDVSARGLCYEEQ